MAIPAEIQRTRQVFLSSIRALAEALEAKDAYTAGHSKRVTEISVDIASAMNLSPAEIGGIRLAAMLHDIGKIGVRESVLNKQGELTPEEYAHVMEHCRIGRRILEPILRNTKVLEIVAHHHDHYDGGGAFPGLRGQEIPLGARIVAVADSVDAMASMRPYRPNLPPGEIVAQLRASSGTQFDSQVVTAFFATPVGAALLESARLAPISPAHPAEAPRPEAAPAANVGDELSSHHDAPAEVAADAQSVAGPLAREQIAPASPSPPAKPLVSREQVIQAVSTRHDVKALPFVTAELLELTSRPDSDTHAITQAILRDPMLVARVLKLANTAYYGSKGRVQTIEHAVVNIGLRAIREIVMAVTVVNLFQYKGVVGTLDRFALWRHNLASAVLCRAIAAKGGRVAGEDAFVSGLLHDLGIAILDNMFPDEYASCVAFARQRRILLVDAEQLFVDTDHPAVGLELSRVWKVDEKFRMPMGMHHKPWREILGSGSGACAAAAVKLADTLARATGAGIECDEFLEEVPDEVPALLNLTVRHVDAIIDALPMDLAELEAIFLMHEPVESYMLERRKPLAGVAGRRALFVSPSDRKVDVIRLLLSSSEAKTSSARDVFTGCAVEKPDLVVLRAPDEPALFDSLKQLRELAAAGAVGPVRVLVLGRDLGAAASVYPTDLTAAVLEPYSIPGLKEHLTALFSNAKTTPAAA